MSEWDKYLASLSEQEREEWRQAMREADEEWERRKYVRQPLTLEQELIEHNHAELLMHC